MSNLWGDASGCPRCFLQGFSQSQRAASLQICLLSDRERRLQFEILWCLVAGSLNWLIKAEQAQNRTQSCLLWVNREDTSDRQGEPDLLCKMLWLYNVFLFLWGQSRWLSREAASLPFAQGFKAQFVMMGKLISLECIPKTLRLCKSPCTLRHLTTLLCTSSWLGACLDVFQVLKVFAYKNVYLGAPLMPVPIGTSAAYSMLPPSNIHPDASGHIPGTLMSQQHCSSQSAAPQTVSNAWHCFASTFLRIHHNTRKLPTDGNLFCMTIIRNFGLLVNMKISAWDFTGKFSSVKIIKQVRELSQQGAASGHPGLGLRDDDGTTTGHCCL